MKKSKLFILSSVLALVLASGFLASQAWAEKQAWGGVTDDTRFSVPVMRIDLAHRFVYTHVTVIILVGSMSLALIVILVVVNFFVRKNEVKRKVVLKILKISLVAFVSSLIQLALRNNIGLLSACGWKGRSLDQSIIFIALIVIFA